MARVREARSQEPTVPSAYSGQPVPPSPPLPAGSPSTKDKQVGRGQHAHTWRRRAQELSGQERGPRPSHQQEGEGLEAAPEDRAGLSSGHRMEQDNLTRPRQPGFCPALSSRGSAGSVWRGAARGQDPTGLL